MLERQRFQKIGLRSIFLLWVACAITSGALLYPKLGYALTCDVNKANAAIDAHVRQAATDAAKAQEERGPFGQAIDSIRALVGGKPQFGTPMDRASVEARSLAAKKVETLREDLYKGAKELSNIDRGKAPLELLVEKADALKRIHDEIDRRVRVRLDGDVDPKNRANIELYRKSVNKVFEDAVADIYKAEQKHIAELKGQVQLVSGGRDGGGEVLGKEDGGFAGEHGGAHRAKIRVDGIVHDAVEKVVPIDSVREERTVEFTRRAGELGIGPKYLGHRDVVDGSGNKVRLIYTEEFGHGFTPVADESGKPLIGTWEQRQKSVKEYLKRIEGAEGPVAHEIESRLENIRAVHPDWADHNLMVGVVKDPATGKTQVLVQGIDWDLPTVLSERSKNFMHRRTASGLADFQGESHPIEIDTTKAASHEAVATLKAASDLKSEAAIRTVPNIAEYVAPSIENPEQPLVRIKGLEAAAAEWKKAHSDIIDRIEQQKKGIKAPDGMLATESQRLAAREKYLEALTKVEEAHKALAEGYTKKLQDLGLERDKHYKVECTAGDCTIRILASAFPNRLKGGHHLVRGTQLIDPKTVNVDPINPETGKRRTGKEIARERKRILDADPDLAIIARSDVVLHTSPGKNAQWKGRSEGNETHYPIITLDLRPTDARSDVGHETIHAYRDVGHSNYTNAPDAVVARSKSGSESDIRTTARAEIVRGQRPESAAHEPDSRQRALHEQARAWREQRHDYRTVEERSKFDDAEYQKYKSFDIDEATLTYAKDLEAKARSLQLMHDEIRSDIKKYDEAKGLWGRLKKGLGLGSKEGPTPESIAKKIGDYQRDAAALFSRASLHRWLAEDAKTVLRVAREQIASGKPEVVKEFTSTSGPREKNGVLVELTVPGTDEPVILRLSEHGKNVVGEVDRILGGIAKRNVQRETTLDRVFEQFQDLNNQYARLIPPGTVKAGHEATHEVAPSESASKSRDSKTTAAAKDRVVEKNALIRDFGMEESPFGLPGKPLETMRTREQWNARFGKVDPDAIEMATTHEYEHLAAVAHAVDEQCPPATCFAVGVGRSPVVVTALLSEYRAASVASVPLSLKDGNGERIRLPLDAVTRDAIYKVFDKLLPGPEKTGNRTIQLVDFVESGGALPITRKIFEEYLRERGRQNKVEVFAFGAPEVVELVRDSVGHENAAPGKRLDGVNGIFVEQRFDGLAEYPSFRPGHTPLEDATSKNPHYNDLRVALNERIQSERKEAAQVVNGALGEKRLDPYQARMVVEAAEDARSSGGDRFDRVDRRLASAGFTEAERQALYERGKFENLEHGNPLKLAAIQYETRRALEARKKTEDASSVSPYHTENLDTYFNYYSHERRNVEAVAAARGEAKSGSGTYENADLVRVYETLKKRGIDDVYAEALVASGYVLDGRRMPAQIPTEIFNAESEHEVTVAAKATDHGSEPSPYESKPKSVTERVASFVNGLFESENTAVENSGAKVRRWAPRTANPSKMLGAEIPLAIGGQKVSPSLEHVESSFDFMATHAGSEIAAWRSPAELMTDPRVQRTMKIISPLIARGEKIPPGEKLLLAIKYGTLVYYNHEIGELGITLQSLDEKPVGYSKIRELKPGEPVHFEVVNGVGRPIALGESVPAEKVHIIIRSRQEPGKPRGPPEVVSILAGDLSARELPADLQKAVFGKQSDEARATAEALFDFDPQLKEYGWTKGELSDSADYWRNHVFADETRFHATKPEGWEQAKDAKELRGRLSKLEKNEFVLKDGTTIKGMGVMDKEGTITIVDEHSARHKIAAADINVSGTLEKMRGGKGPAKAATGDIYNAALAVNQMRGLARLHTSRDERVRTVSIDRGIPSEPNALAYAHPEIIAQLEGIRSEFPNTGTFIEAFKQKYQREPTVKEVLLYNSNQYHAVLQSYRKLAAKYANTPLGIILDGAVSDLKTRVRNKAFDALKNLEDSPLRREKFSWNNPEHVKLVPIGDLRGVTGDIEVAVRTGDFHDTNMKLDGSTPYPEVVEGRIKELIAAHGSEAAAYAEFKKQFPLIAERSTSGDFKGVRAWIRAKEIDVVQKKGDRISGWTEVKYHNEPISLEKLNEADGVKSIFDQAREAVELRKFFGVERDLTLKSAFINGIEASAKAKLESIGIEVVGAVHPDRVVDSIAARIERAKAHSAELDKLGPGARGKDAIKILGLTDEKLAATVARRVEKAHDDVPCAIGGCTREQLREKAKILHRDEHGNMILDHRQVRMLVEAGTVGDPVVRFKEELQRHPEENDVRVLRKMVRKAFPPGIGPEAEGEDISAMSVAELKGVLNVAALRKVLTEEAVANKVDGVGKGELHLTREEFWYFDKIPDLVKKAEGRRIVEIEESDEVPYPRRKVTVATPGVYESHGKKYFKVTDTPGDDSGYYLSKDGNTIDLQKQKDGSLKVRYIVEQEEVNEALSLIDAAMKRKPEYSEQLQWAREDILADPVKARRLNDAHAIGLRRDGSKPDAAAFSHEERIGKIVGLSGEGGWNLKDSHQKQIIDALLKSHAAGDEARASATEIAVMRRDVKRAYPKINEESLNGLPVEQMQDMLAQAVMVAREKNSVEVLGVKYVPVKGSVDLVEPRDGGDPIIRPARVLEVADSVEAKLGALPKKGQVQLSLTPAEALYLRRYAPELADKIPNRARIETIGAPKPALELVPEDDAPPPANPKTPSKVSMVGRADKVSGTVVDLMTGKTINNAALASVIEEFGFDPEPNSTHPHKQGTPAYGSARNTGDLRVLAAIDPEVQRLTHAFQNTQDPSEKFALRSTLEEHLYAAGHEPVAVPPGYPRTGAAVESVGRRPYMEAMGFRSSHEEGMVDHEIVWARDNIKFTTMDNHWARISRGESLFVEGKHEIYKTYMRLSPADLAAHLPEILKIMDSVTQGYQLKFAYAPSEIGRPDRIVAHFKTPEEALAVAEAISKFAQEKGLKAMGQVPFTGLVASHVSVGRDIYWKNDGISGRQDMASRIAESLLTPQVKGITVNFADGGITKAFVPELIQEIFTQRAQAQTYEQVAARAQGYVHEGAAHTRAAIEATIAERKAQGKLVGFMPDEVAAVQAERINEAFVRDAKNQREILTVQKGQLVGASHTSGSDGKTFTINVYDARTGGSKKYFRALEGDHADVDGARKALMLSELSRSMGVDVYPRSELARVDGTLGVLTDVPPGGNVHDHIVGGVDQQTRRQRLGEGNNPHFSNLQNAEFLFLNRDSSSTKQIGDPQTRMIRSADPKEAFGTNYDKAKINPNKSSSGHETAKVYTQEWVDGLNKLSLEDRGRYKWLTQAERDAIKFQRDVQLNDLRLRQAKDEKVVMNAPPPKPIGVPVPVAVPGHRRPAHQGRVEYLPAVVAYAVGDHARVADLVAKEYRAATKGKELPADIKSWVEKTSRQAAEKNYPSDYMDKRFKEILKGLCE